MRGRPPKPTRLHILEGNPSKKKLNRREPEPESGIPAPPPELGEAALDEWLRITPILYDMRVLTHADLGALTAYCEAFGTWVELKRRVAAGGQEIMLTSEKGYTYLNPIYPAIRQALQDVVKFSHELGLTPSARSRLQIDPAPVKSKFDGLIGRRAWPDQSEVEPG